MLLLTISSALAKSPPNSMEVATKQYTRYSIERLKNAEELLERLSRKLEAGRYKTVKEDYIKAHYQYESARPLVLLTPGLNNLVDTHIEQLPKDTQSLGFVGFHAIEYALFVQPDPVRAFVETQKLLSNLRFVINMMQQQNITPQDMLAILPVFTHQILTHKLPGYDSSYSGSGLGEVAANLEGIRLIINQTQNFIPPSLIADINQTEDRIYAILDTYLFEDIYQPYANLKDSDKTLIHQEVQRLSELLIQVNEQISSQLTE